MQVKTCPLGWLKWWMCPALGVFLIPVSPANGQTQVSLQALQPTPKVVSPVFVSLPQPEIAHESEILSPATLPTRVEVQPWVLKELPRIPSAEMPSVAMPSVAMPNSEIPSPEGRASITVADITTYAVSSSTGGIIQAPPVMKVVSLDSLQAPPAEKKSWDKYFDLDVDEMTKEPCHVLETFKDLPKGSKYFESALMAEPTRLQSPEVGPYTWSAHGYCWESATFCFSPLYFEQTNLERYGQGIGRPFTSASSAVAFVTDVTTLPIALVCSPPWSSSCTLGHHRPGNCAPYQGKTLDH